MKENSSKLFGEEVKVWAACDRVVDRKKIF